MNGRALGLGLLLVLSGCAALFQKSEPLSVQYYAPAERAGRYPVAQTRSEGPPLRLGRVSAAAYLDVRMLQRSEGNALTYREAARWTENPARFLERALAHALFEERGVVEAISGRALTLDAELVAFEESRAGSAVARVAIVFTLHDERVSLLRETLSVERDLSEGELSPRAVVAALSSALDACVDQIADGVVAARAR